MHQEYQTDVVPEYVIKGNSALLKCNIPSFVADFVSVASWVTDKGDTYLPSDKYGNNKEKLILMNVFFIYSFFIKIFTIIRT